MTPYKKTEKSLMTIYSSAKL